MFSKKRLAAARLRRKMTSKQLAEQTGLSPVTITRLENGQNEPDRTTLEKIAKAVGYPVEFFTLPDPPELSTSMVSFRSLANMSARERDAALRAGDNGVELFDWASREFSLPQPAVPDLRTEAEFSPEAAAETLRQQWGLGDRPIHAVLKLFEFKGIRILGLSEDTANVDAFSFWRNDVPYMFLNSFKSAERNLFDAAHELGHLTMHRQGTRNGSRALEHEANAFASAFLMPRTDVLAHAPRFIDVRAILRLKQRWKVSAMALAFRFRTLQLLTEWQYRSICIELGQSGYRTGEPNGVEREHSAVWQKILEDMWAERQGKQEIANALCLPLDEIEALMRGILPGEPRVTEPQPLRVVK